MSFLIWALIAYFGIKTIVNLFCLLDGQRPTPDEATLGLGAVIGAVFVVLIMVFLL